MKLNSDFKQYEKINSMRGQFIDFTKKIWEQEITLLDNGSAYYKALKNVLELEDLYKEIENKYQLIYKDLNIDKNNKYYLILIVLLVFSLCLNLINVLLLMYYLS